MNKLPLCIVFAALFISGVARAAAPNVKEGLWEVTARVEEPKDRASTRPTTVQHCITEKDLQNPQKIVPGGDAGSCEIKDQKTQGNVVSWTIACNGKTPMTGSGSITFSGMTYTGQSTLKVNRSDGAVNVTVRYDGKYVGPCKK